MHATNRRRILLSQAHVTKAEEEPVLEALRSGWVAPLGPFVDQFEAAIAERVGVGGALALSSGTAALHLALLHAGAKPGRKVLVPTLTFAATANAVLYTGAEPVFIDSRADDGNVDPALLIEAATAMRASGVDIAAAVPVDIYGRVADYDVIEGELAALDIPMVADATESLGSTLNGRPAGSFGQSASFSFNGNKVMTTSGGGMLVSNDPELIARARYLSAQARMPTPWYEHVEVGWNYRMSNILAALGCGQLSRLDEMIARRRAHRKRYAEGLQDVPGVTFLGRDTERGDSEDNCWLTCIVMDPAQIRTSPGEVIAALESEDIESRHLWNPLHKQPMYRDAQVFNTGVSEALFARGLSLPSGAALSDDDIDRVVDALVRTLAPRSYA